MALSKKWKYCTGQYTKEGAQNVAQKAREQGCTGVCIRKRTDNYGDYWMVYCDR